MPERTVSLELDSLPLELMRQVNLLADRYEAELLAGAGPSAASFVAELDDPQARLVFLRLIMLTERELGGGDPRAVAPAPSKLGDGARVSSPRVVEVDPGEARCIPGYEIETELGRGGMGIVYLAHQRALNRRVALKVLFPGPHDGPELRARFRREAQLAAQCRHANLVQIYQTGEHAGLPYLALEYAEGGSLEKRLNGTPWAPRRAAEFLEPVARAVAEAHEHGIVHRDIKPANILLDTAGTPKVGDFGLATLAGQEARLTATGVVLGTPSYMSPEQAEGHSDRVGPATDVYSLGAVLYELLTGRPPFRGKSAVETLKQVREVDVVPPSQIVPAVPRDLETICLTCLAKEPVRRYPRAADLAEDLRRFLDGRTIEARRASPSERLRRWCRRNPWIASFIALLIVGLGLTSWLLWRANRAEGATRRAALAALAEADVAKAVNDFFLKDVLAQAAAHGQARPGTRTDSNLKVRTALDRAATRIEGQFAGKPLVEAAIRRTIGESYASLALFSQARPHLERARALFLRERGSEHPDTLAVLGALAQLCLDQDQLAEAEALMRERIAAARRGHGDRGLETFKAEHDLAFLFIRQEKYADAERLLSRVLVGLRALLGEDHPDTLSAMNSHAQLSFRRRQFDDAERTYLKVVKARTGSRGEEHPETLNALSDLALVYTEQKKYDLAESTLNHVLDVRRRAFNDRHPSTLDAKESLATFYAARNQFPKAESLLVEVLKDKEEVLGEVHSATLLTMNNLGMVYLQQSNFPKAEPLFVRLLETRRRFLDWSQPHTVTATIAAVDDLSALRVIEGKLKEATPLLKESLELRQRWLGAEHPETVAAMQHLAQTYLFLGQLAEAEPLFEKVLEQYRQEPGGDPVETARTLDNLGEISLQLRDFRKAEHSLRDCLIVRRKLAPDSWQTFLSQAKLGASLLGQKKYAEAERELLAGYEGLKSREATIPAEAKGQRRRVAAWLVELYEAIGRTDKAEEWRTR